MIKPAKFTMPPKFDQAIHEESANDLYSARNAKFNELALLIAKINELRDKGANTRSTRDKFYRLKADSEDLKSLLKIENRDLCKAFFKLNPKLAEDTKFKEDQAAFVNWIEQLDDALSELTEKMETEGVIPVIDPTDSLAPSQAPAASDVNTILLKLEDKMSKQQERMEERMSKQQQDQEDRMLQHQERQDKQQTLLQLQQDQHWTDMHKQLGTQFSTSQKEIKDSQIQISEALKASTKSKLKRIQPTFRPNRDLDDYSLYRQFKRDFEHFITDVRENNWIDKARWIVECVKEDAYQLIKNITLDEAGYNKAFTDLDAKYLCTNVIEDNIFHFIHTFSIPNTGKNHSTLSSKLISLRNYIQELTDSHGFVMNDSLRKFIGHIIMKGLPQDVKKQFYLDTATLYPDYNAILNKVDTVIQTLNKIGLNSKDSTMKHNPSNNSSNNASKAQVIGSVINQPSSSSKTGYKRRIYKGRRNGKMNKCRFCQSADHSSTNCTKYLTPESRIAALRGREGHEVCHKCTQKHTGECKDGFWGRCKFEKSCKANPHQFSICPSKCKALTTKTTSTKPTIVDTVVALPSRNANELQKAELIHSTINSHDTNESSNVGGLYVSGKRKRSVALETATFTAFNDSCSNMPLHERGVSALLDTGAQCTMITSETVDRLGLEIVEREAATLQGFGNVKPINKIYNIVKVILGKAGSNSISVHAIVVKTLSPIPMIGACAIGKRLAKYTKLADYRLLNGKSDTFPVDILIGNDYRGKFVSRSIRPKQILGMWLSSTIYGDAILSGPLPGSEGLLDINQSANVITVCTIIDKPLSIDEVVKLKSVTDEKHLSNITGPLVPKLDPFLGNIEQFLHNIVPFVGINVPLLSILITGKQKRQNVVINNCKSNFIKYPNAFDHLDSNSGSKVISDFDSLAAIPVKPKSIVSVFSTNIISLKQGSIRNNNLEVMQGSEPVPGRTVLSKSNINPDVRYVAFKFDTPLQITQYCIWSGSVLCKIDSLFKYIHI